MAKKLEPDERLWKICRAANDVYITGHYIQCFLPNRLRLTELRALQSEFHSKNFRFENQGQGFKLTIFDWS
jgi:hypothetical protein